MLVKFWRKHGIQIGVFLDDGLAVAGDESKLAVDAQFVKDSLFRAGFVVNEEKSVWVPTKSLIWLGVQVDTASGKFSIPDKRVRSLFDSLNLVIQSLPYTSARKLAG